MPTLFARRYARKTEEVGKTEKVLGLVILLLAAGTIAAFVVQVATNEDYLFDVDEQAYAPATESDAAKAETVDTPPVEGQNPFPEPGLEGWRAPTRVDRFDQDNLYMEIDGRAVAYLRQGVVGLTVGSYHHRDDADRTLDVYLYDMGEPANALAMYRSEEAPDAPRVPLGQEGYQVGGAVFFCKGSSYVQVLPSRLDDADAHAALKIAERVAERIEE